MTFNFFVSFPQNSRPPSLWTIVILNIFNMWCAIITFAALFITWSIVAFVVSQFILYSSQTKTRFRWLTSRIFSFDGTILVASFPQWEVKRIDVQTTRWHVFQFDHSVVYQSVSERPCDVNGELLILFYCSIVSAKIMHKYFNTVACKTQILLQIIN